MSEKKQENAFEVSAEQLELLECLLAEEGVEGDESTRILPRGEGREIPLSFAQKRLWFIDKLESAGAAYHISAAYYLNGHLNVAVLQSSLNEIVRRHEALRTTFQSNNGRPYQVVSPPRSMEFPLIDLKSLPRTEKDAEVHRLVRENAGNRFDLYKGPLFRGSVLELGAEEHALLLCMHHIVSDGWSMNVLFRELAILYEALARGKPSPLRELSIQYADFAVWQKEWLQGEVLQEQLQYWKTQLGNMVYEPILVADRPRPPIQTYRGAVHSFKLGEPLTGLLHTLSRCENVTLFMLLLAAFKVLLYRYSGQDHIALGSPIANRNRTETEALIGFFVNTLVMRSDLSGNPDFRELLTRVRETAVGAYAHQDLPFDILVEKLQPARSLSHSPLFQVMFMLRNAEVDSFHLADLAVTPIPGPERTAKFDTVLSIIDREPDINVSLVYNSDLFETATMTRLGAHFRTLLESIAADPSTPINSLTLMTEAERRQVVVDWNCTRSEYPAEAGLNKLFAIQAERTPEAVALVFGQDRLTYRELNQQANQLAHHLRNSGVKAEELVGVCLDRSTKMIVAFLGILKAGGAYVPIDPSYPNARIAFMAEDSGLRWLVTETRMLDRFDQKTLQAVCVDRDRKQICAESVRNPESISSGASAAYVIYTSGSTGKPKGVLVTHKAVTRLVVNTDYVILTPTDVVAQVSNASFDAITFEVWGALLNGGRLVGVATDVLLSPKAFAATIKQQKISTMFLTTALFNQLALEVPSAFHTVDNLLFGGEACEPECVKAILRHGPPNRLLHMYGPTEATTFASWYLVQQIRDGASTIPIGRPINNCQIYILDECLQPVPIGVAGELYIGGDGLARGYLNRPELTAERFVDNPFSVRSGSRLYKSGDQARFLPDGNIELVGRLDHQVKLRGFRIEPGEIEETLRLHSEVQQVVVLPRENRSGSKQLVAYIVPRRKPGPAASELRRWAAASLPDYMVPANFIHLTEVPLTANGKVDRQALRAIDVPTMPNEAGSGPRDELEAQLATIWKRTLDLPLVSVRDNFFEVGGHSLLAVQLLADIERSTGGCIALADFFQAPTIEDTACLLRQKGSSSPVLKTRLVPIQRLGTKPAFFLLQGTLEIARHMTPDQPFYTCLPHGEDGLPVPPTVSAIAADYIREIRRVQPNGPYLFGGFSFTGLVAFEMAQQLKQAGEQVAMLALVDPTPARSQRAPRQRVVSAESFSAYVRRHFKSLEPRPARVASRVWRAIYWRLSNKIRVITTPVKWMVCRALLPIWTRLPIKPYALRKFYFLQASQRVGRKYHPKVYDGDVILFQSEALVQETLWRSLISGKLTVHQLPGDHIGMVREPNAGIIANALKAHLTEAQATAGRTKLIIE